MTEKRLNDLAVSETGFVFDPYSGATFSTNLSGLEILKHLKLGASRQAIVEALREAFDVVERDADLDRHIVESDYELG